MDKSDTQADTGSGTESDAADTEVRSAALRQRGDAALALQKGEPRVPLALAAVGGVAFALSSPPTDLYPLVILGLTLQYAAIRHAPSGWRAFGRGLFWATVAGLVGMRFVPQLINKFTALGYSGGTLALVLVSAFQGLWWGVGAAVQHQLAKRLRLDPRLAFAMGTVVAISMPAVFQWTPAGLMSPWPILVQAADVVGERGVSFVLALAAALLASPWVDSPKQEKPQTRFRGPAIAALLTAVLLVYGAVRMPMVAAADGTKTIRLGVVQAAIEARMRWKKSQRATIHKQLRRLTRESEQAGSELTVWPEAAYPYVLPHRAGRTFGGFRRIVGRGVTGPVLVGALTQKRGSKFKYNAATVVDRRGVMQLPQAKMRLLWFGEAIPMSEYLPFLRTMFSRAGGLAHGESVELLASGDARMGVLNCYEDTLPEIGRKVAQRRPNLLINVTNDAWFGDTAEPELHLRLSVMRSIETRLHMVRAVNLGVPAWIDARGVIRKRGSESEVGVMYAEPSLNEKSPTLFTRIGDFPLFGGLTLTALIAWWRRRRDH